MNGVTRHYVTVGDRQVHYRRAGAGPPVVLLHESPLSCARYAGLARALGARFTAIALDTPGYGGSDPLAQTSPAIADYASALALTLDALGIERCGLYGAHTGAAIALELAASEPRRVAALVLDGLLLPTPQERRELLECYCPALEPQIDGTHLLAAWSMRRDMHVYFPWYERHGGASVRATMPDAAALHEGMLDHLRAGAGYGLGYAAAFRYEAIAPLRGLTMPATVLAAAGDVLAAHLRRLPAELPEGVAVVRDHPAAPAAAAQAIAGHLAPAAALAPAPPAPAPVPRTDRITRDYGSTSVGQLHLRARGGGGGRPLLLIHGSPTSAAMLEPLLDRLAASRPVFAFDTFGNGESDKPDPERFAAAQIADFAEVLLEAIDDVGLGELDLYGTHTGAAIAIEAALRLERRVGRIILDGVAMFDEGTVAEFLERYFIDMTPRTDGAHLVSAWSTTRDSTIWFPWYRRDPEHRYREDAASAGALHRALVEFLKSGASYALPYRAAFTYRAPDRLARLRVPTLVAVGRGDPLFEFLDAAVDACPVAAGLALPEDPDETAARFAWFLDHRDGGHA